jgi:hypothetical protein
MSQVTELAAGQISGIVHPQFESIVDRIIKVTNKETLADLRRDFHNRLRITLTHPDKAELIEDLWDFFYDWCVFEKRLPDNMSDLPQNIQTEWAHVKEGNTRGLYEVSKVTDKILKAKELFTGNTVELHCRNSTDFLGISKGDIIESRLVKEGEAKKQYFNFVRKPSFHPVEVHSYIKRKVKEFKKNKDFETYQTWLWLLVGMYLKHRIYDHMPIDKIYDDNSRI